MLGLAAGADRLDAPPRKSGRRPGRRRCAARPDPATQAVPPAVGRGGATLSAAAAAVRIVALVHQSCPRPQAERPRRPAAQPARRGGRAAADGGPARRLSGHHSIEVATIVRELSARGFSFPSSRPLSTPIRSVFVCPAPLDGQPSRTLCGARRQTSAVVADCSCGSPWRPCSATAGRGVWRGGPGGSNRPRLARRAVGEEVTLSRLLFRGCVQIGPPHRLRAGPRCRAAPSASLRAGVLFSGRRRDGEEVVHSASMLTTSSTIAWHKGRRLPPALRVRSPCARRRRARARCPCPWRHRAT